MDWSKGFSASYVMQTVDPATWRDTGVIQITGGNIKRELTGKRESADVDCKGIEIGVERWVRIYLETQQDGDSARTALFTGLATTPADEYEGNAKSNTLACYSVLKPCEDVSLPIGWYAPQNANGAEVIRQLLSVTPAPVFVADGSPMLSEHIIAEANENHLTMIDKIITAIDWRIRIDGDGSIHIGPHPVETVATLGPLENDVIETKVKVSADLYACPNVYRATSGDVTGIARDEDPDSPLSIQNRGREVWKSESGVNLASTESIAQYARRRLKESQRVQKVASYTRRYLPDVKPSDLIRMSYPAQGLTGVYMVQSQTVALEYGASTDEQIAEVI